LNKIFTFQEKICIKIGTKKDLVNLRITQFLGCWETLFFSFCAVRTHYWQKAQRNVFKIIELKTAASGKQPKWDLHAFEIKICLAD